MIRIENHGLLTKPQNANLDNIELRVTLEKAVDDAKLNVTERAALNHKFFPHGDGFILIPKGEKSPEFNYYYVSGESNFHDSFTKELQEMDIPEGCQKQEHIFKSSKDNFQANLDNALKKLAEVLKGNI